MVKINKKGNELTLQTLIMYILAIIVLAVVIYFFATKYTSNSTDIISIGNSSIQAAKDFNPYSN